MSAVARYAPRDSMSSPSWTIIESNWSSSLPTTTKTSFASLTPPFELVHENWPLLQLPPLYWNVRTFGRSLSVQKTPFGSCRFLHSTPVLDTHSISVKSVQARPGFDAGTGCGVIPVGRDGAGSVVENAIPVALVGLAVSPPGGLAGRGGLVGLGVDAIMGDGVGTGVGDGVVGDGLGVRGALVGLAVETITGDGVGTEDGPAVGDKEGVVVGSEEGVVDGVVDGVLDGVGVGSSVGTGKTGGMSTESTTYMMLNLDKKVPTDSTSLKEISARLFPAVSTVIKTSSPCKELWAVSPEPRTSALTTIGRT